MEPWLDQGRVGQDPLSAYHVDSADDQINRIDNGLCRSDQERRKYEAVLHIDPTIEIQF
jgi:hypothetical protein